MEKSWLVGLFFFFISCQNQNVPPIAAYQKVQGQTMGTTYAITYQSDQDIKPIVEEVLKEVNLGVNHYDPNSVISKFNRATSHSPLTKEAIHQHFYKNLTAAKSIFEATNGAFDPTIMPLVNYWGFGYTGKKPVTAIDTLTIDSLLQFVGFEKVQIATTQVTKENPSIQLDFSAIAKGYGVDQVGEAIEKQGIGNYLVDIGGEVRARGINKKGIPWRLGINTPSAEAAINDYLAVISLENHSMATSGNYRNFYEVDGVRYAHTINPTTGYSELNTLLSATVIAADCMTADGYATAFMTMGLEKAVEIAEKNKNIHGYFLFSKENGSIGVQYTEGMKPFLVE